MMTTRIGAENSNNRNLPEEETVNAEKNEEKVNEGSYLS
jgi:hypothetical protein